MWGRARASLHRILRLLLGLNDLLLAFPPHLGLLQMRLTLFLRPILANLKHPS